MKKYNEGYSLVLVLVVMTVLCLIASFILSFSLQNLQTQTASVERMQDRYKTAGEIEKIAGQLDALIQGSSESPVEIVNAVISEEDPNKIEGTVSSGTVQIDYVLELTEADCMEDHNKVTIGSLEGFEYVSYDISTAEEVGGE